MSKLMSVKKQWKLKEGDYVVMKGVERPGVVTSVDLEDEAAPVQVKFHYNGRSSESCLWGHPPIIRRYPRVGEKVVIKAMDEKDSHDYDVGDVVTVEKVDVSGRQELFCQNDSGLTQWVYEAGAKRVKKGKAGA